MTDKQKENNRAQNAEVLMWLVFICCGMMIAFVEFRPFFPAQLQDLQGEKSGRYPALIEYTGFIAALCMCFPPFHSRMLQNSVRPFIDVCKRSVAAFAMVALFKGVFII